jgi:iron complex outermembrane recepter protein
MDTEVRISARRDRVALSGIVAVGLMTAATAVAQPAPNDAAPALLQGVAVAQAQAGAVVAFNIPAQDLSGAVLSFAEKAGIQVFYDAGRLRGLSSPGISGSYTVEGALRLLLAGTNVTYRFTSPTTVTLERASGDSSGVTTLPPIEIAAPRQERPKGPVDGYVAKRSVTATKTDTPLMETPQSISVITRAQMDAQGAQNLRQALRYAPGVNYIDSNDVRFETVTARGFALDTYRDGLRQLGGTFGLFKTDPYFLERAEVLSGPSSILYGQASPGGVLNLVSKRPTATPFQEVLLQTGTFDRKQGAFDLSGPVDDKGEVLYRLTGIFRDADTQTDYIREERRAIAPAVTWRPNDGTSITLLSEYLYDPASGSWAQLPMQGTLLPNINGDISRNFFVGDKNFEKFERTQYAIGYEVEHEFNEIFTARQNFRYARVETDYAEVQGSTLMANQRTLIRSAFMSRELLDTFTIDNHLQGKFDTGPVKHTALLGVDYQRKLFDNLARWANGGAPTLDILNPNYNQNIATPPLFQNNDQRQDQIGVYLQDQIKLDNWILLAGLRKDNASNINVNHINNTTFKQSDGDLTGRVGLMYLFDFGLAPYVSYSTSFQPIAAGTSFTGAAFQPTTGEQYEAGIKFQPKGIDSYMTAAVYDLTQQNVQTPDPDHVGFSIQTGEVRSRGVELAAVMSLGEGVSVRSSYTYLDNEITKANDATLGKRLANIPANIASVWADYTVPEGTLAGFGFGGGAKYVGSTYTTNANTQKIPAYTLYDAALHYDLSRISTDLRGARLQLNAMNLLDKEYISDCSALGCRYGLGRTVYLTLAYRW